MRVLCHIMWVIAAYGIVKVSGLETRHLDMHRAKRRPKVHGMRKSKLNVNVSYASDITLGENVRRCFSCVLSAIA